MYLGNFVEVGEKRENLQQSDASVYAATAFRSSGSGSDGKKRKNSCLREASHPPTEAADRLQIPYQMSKMHGMLQNTGWSGMEVDDGHYVHCHLLDKERRKQQK